MRFWGFQRDLVHKKLRKKMRDEVLGVNERNKGWLLEEEMSKFLRN